ncbi:MAG: mycothiol system anti-sigma-R factor [Jiangellaceae bacterium]|nr:mycothiol system anti-sigma-R factor [Jiangellaceae bacterium]
MSCGRPHETDCAEILDRIYVFLDGEMDGGPESYALVERHLDECAPCLSEYDLERVLKALVARSCGGEHAPPQLRQRVLTRIRQIRVEVAEIVEF